MIAALANHLWQSTVFAVAIALLATAFRGNRARVRYWLWFTASLKFLIPFAPLMMLGHQMLSWASPEPGSPPPGFFAVTAITQPLLDIPVPVGAVNAVTPDYLPLSVSVFGVWAVGLISIAFVRFRTWRRIRNRMRMGTPSAARNLDIPRHVRVRAVPGLMEPGVVGIWHQTLMLPCDIDRHLTRQELRAVVAHERCHIRHMDNLTAAIHMFVEAVCWFHPAVWLIGSRLVDERERACDEEVLTTIGTPQVYAEAILNVCKRYVAVPSPSFAGVSSANLRARIEAIMAERIGCSLNARRKIALALAAIVSLTVPVATGATRAFGQGKTASAEQRTASTVKFEAASLRLNVSGSENYGINRMPGGRLTAINAPLARLITWAYGLQPFQLQGGPEWLSDRFDIVARVEGNPREVAPGSGPDGFMLAMQNLLAERFRLQARRTTREGMIYALVVARSDGRLGPQLVRSSIDCVAQLAQPNTVPADCGLRANDGRLRMRGMPIQALATGLTAQLQRTVIDRTKLVGPWDFEMKFSKQDLPLPDSDAPVLFTALQEQLGLKLESTKGLIDVLVIDRLDRPVTD